jgi:hypothetical protein
MIVERSRADVVVIYRLEDWGIQNGPSGKVFWEQEEDGGGHVAITSRTRACPLPL